MSMQKTTKMANRYGLNLKLTNIKDETESAIIDFANEVSIEVSGEITWATGGQGHVNMIGFRDPKEGTLTISTQVTNMQVMQLLCGGNLNDDSGIASFKDDAKIALKYYKIEGETVWQDEEGTVYNEKITAYKCFPKPNFTANYTGAGDPISLDVEFELSVDKNGNFLDIERHEAGDIAYADVDPIEDQPHTGDPVEPELHVTYSGEELTKDVDYTVEYANNEDVGEASATITGKGEYNGTKTVKFNIVE